MILQEFLETTNGRELEHVSKLKDLTGMTFGRLYVVGRARDYVSPSGNRKPMWACICSCGGSDCIKAVVGSDLVSGNTASCGCGQREAGLQRLKDLTGQRFGRLTVMSRASNKGKDTCWNCICHCNCGNEVEVVVLGGNLVSGHTTSCGCVRRELVSERNLNNLVGQIFGRLTVISRAENKSEHTCWNCICSCGGENCVTVVLGSNLVTGHTESCGCTFKETHSGSNSHFWKNGITPLNQVIRTSAEYKTWRKVIFERDNYTCQYSGVAGCKLVAHHIKPFAQILEENNITTVDEAIVCEELWDISNGVTLAKEYHSQISKNPLSFHKMYGTHSTEQDFYKWLEGK